MASMLVVFASLFSYPITAMEISDVAEESARQYLKLRRDVMARKDFSPYWGSDEERKELLGLFKAGKYKDFIGNSPEWIEKMPIDIQMHLVLSIAHLELGQYKEYIRCYTTYMGLLDSILMTGDGRTIETAFWVTSVEEEYDVLRGLSLKLVEQELLKEGVDEMDCVTEAGKKITLYFDVRDTFKTGKMR
jgi:hypothetical protein